MRIHIVCYDDYDAWILGKIARRLHAELVAMGIPASLGKQPDPSAEINHHIIYDDYIAAARGVETVMITHIANDGELQLVRRQLIEGDVAMGICMSSDTVQRLAELGIPRQRLCFIGPAHDGAMRPRKTLVGLATRLYQDGRKRERLLEELAKAISPHEFRFAIMGSGWDLIVDRLRVIGFEVEYVDHFDRAAYASMMPSLDYFLYLGEDEGSMAWLDALAAGVSTIVTPQGFHLDVPDGITHAFRDLAELRAVFDEIAAHKKRRATSVARHTWSENARKHVLVWKYLLHRQRRQEIPADVLGELDGVGVVP